MLLYFSYSPHLLGTANAVKELETFLEDKKGKPFNFLKECLIYCRNDTLILFLAVLSLELELLKQSKYEISFIFSSAFTLAQLSSIFYRQLYMPANSIGKPLNHSVANAINCG